jgi:hypothetical protein
MERNYSIGFFLTSNWSLVTKGIKTFPQPPFSLDITPANLFLFPRVKSEMAGLSKMSSPPPVGYCMSVATSAFSANLAMTTLRKVEK